MPKPTASLSLDLDNLWVYLKTRGVAGWEEARSYLPSLVPMVLDLLERRGLKITFFIIGRDAAAAENRETLEQIVRAGHECGNHSYHHEPWIQHHDKDQVAKELKQAHLAIEGATGQSPVGFRGPGYAHSAATLEAVKELGYDFDASILPSIIGPLARLYYFWSSGLNRKERHTRRGLFGCCGPGSTLVTMSASPSLRPLRASPRRENRSVAGRPVWGFSLSCGRENAGTARCGAPCRARRRSRPSW